MESEKLDTPETEKPVKRFKINDRALAISVLVLLVVFIIGSDPHFRKTRMERRACLTLRSIGTSQLAYRYTNNQKDVGTLEDLQNGGLISKDLTLNSIVFGYHVNWRLMNPPRLPLGVLNGGGPHFYTIVAYPEIFYPTGLRTFGISEDQVVRVYNPDHGNTFVSRDDPIVKSWDVAPEPEPNRFYIFIEKVKDFIGL